MHERPGCFEIPSADIALHFARKERGADTRLLPDGHTLAELDNGGPRVTPSLLGRWANNIPLNICHGTPEERAICGGSDANCRRDPSCNE